MQRLKVPNGLSGVGYGKADIPSLVEGTLPQERVTKLSPRPAGKAELTRLFEDALVAWSSTRAPNAPVALASHEANETV